MANVKIVFPNHTQSTTVHTVTAYGLGSPDLWVDLDNLQGEVLSEMARYPGVDPDDTQFVIDFGTIRNFGAFAIPFHNGQEGDTFQIKIYSDAALTDLVYDTGATEIFGEMYPWESLAAERVEWIDGKMNPEDCAGRIIPWQHVIGHEVTGRYALVLANFSGNSDGFVDIGRIVAGPVVTPTYNIAMGVTVPIYRDPSTKSRSKGGPSFSDRRKAYRSSKMSFKWATLAETYQTFSEMIRRNGISEPIYFIYDSDADKYVLVNQSFMATIENQVEVKNENYALYDFEAEIAEAF